MKILPKVFPAGSDKVIRNNKTVSYSKFSEEKTRDESLVREKINKIFKRDEQIYSIDCLIYYENNTEKYTIIGVTSNHLITSDRKLISISEIYDIELAQSLNG